MDSRRLTLGALALLTIGVIAGVAALSRYEGPGPAVLALSAQEVQEPDGADEPFKPNPALIVAPLHGEPAWPATFERDVVAKPGRLTFPGGYLFTEKDAAGNAYAGVAVAGVTLMDRGPIELFACGPGGKDHESIVRLECDVQALDLALTLCGLRRGGLPRQLGVADARQGSRVTVLLQWTQDGKTVTHRAEDLVLSVQRQKPMPRVGWTYVGAWVDSPDPTAPARKSHRVLAAANTQSLITTFRDPSSLLDNPMEEAVDDSLFGANFMLLPPPKTPVVVIFRPPTADDARTIAAAEQEFRK